MKKLFIFIISLFVCIGVFQTRVMAEGESYFVDEDDDRPTDVTTPPDSISYANGTIPNPFVINSKYYGFEELGKELPEKYLTSSENTEEFDIDDLDDTYDLDSIFEGKEKPRSKFAISWAEAVCQATEREYNRLHVAKGGTEVDLSEMHLAWFAYNNDGTTTTKNGTDVFNIGGSPAMATLALANGIGFVEEEKFPMKDSYTSSELATYTNSTKAYEPDYELCTSEWFPLKTDLDIIKVKKALYFRGPLAVSFHLSDKYLKYQRAQIGLNDETFAEFPEETKSRFRITFKDNVFLTKDLAEDLGESIEPNYSGLLVGWIDDYSTTHKFNLDLINAFNYTDTLVPNQDYTFQQIFNKEVYWRTKTPCTPTKTGVWIVRVNVVDSAPTYYYFSFDDESISNSLAVYFQLQNQTNPSILTHELDKNSGFNYYEDNDNEAIFYNVYTPQKKEYIDSIGLFTYQNDVDYKVAIFAGDLENVSIDDLFNEKVECLVEEGTLPTAGYHRISLRGDVSSLNYNSIGYAGYQDDKLYAIVQYTTPEGTHVLVPTDGAAKSIGDFSEKSTATANLTSVLVDNNSNIDLVTLTGGPAKVKLFTYGIDNKIIYHLGEGVTIPEGTKEFYRDYDEQDIIPTPTKEGYEFYAWYTDSELSDEGRIIERPTKVTGNLDLYPAFKQRVVFKYQKRENNELKNVEEIRYVNNYQYKEMFVPKIEVPSIETGKEFAGWEYTDSKATKHTLNLYDGSYVFEDAKLNGEDIVLTPLFEKVEPKTYSYTPDEIAQMTKDLEDKGVKFEGVKVSPGAPQIISVVNADELTDATKDDEDNSIFDNKAVLWFEATEIIKTEDDSDEASKQYEGFKEIFEKIVENITYKVCKLIDINMFAQEEGESEGTKVAELTKKVSVEYDLSGDENAELREAAENGKLQISQMHNGEILDIDPDDIVYDKETMKLKFKVQKFSIFAFTVGTPTPADTPSGESGDTPTGGDTTGGDTSGGSDTNKSTENKSTDTTTPNPDFKTPNTGIY